MIHIRHPRSSALRAHPPHSNPAHALLPRFVIAFIAYCSWIGTANSLLNADVQIKKSADKISVLMDGAIFTELNFKDVSRPFLYPIIGPGGARMTRDWPMADTPNEDHDHPHHRALWFTHGDANKVDFWSEGAKAGKTVQSEISEVKSGKQSGLIRTKNEWLSKEGVLVAKDERTMVFHEKAGVRFIDFKIDIHPHGKDLVLGDTKEGTMAIRLAETMRLKGKVGQGHIINSEGVKDGDTWGKRAKWVDYFGPVNGKVVGVAMFDHPSNPRHPTWWHVRDYGLFAANPFGVHDFEKKPAGTGDMIVPLGKSLKFQYRFVFHAGNDEQAGIPNLYEAYAKTKGIE